VGETDEVGDVLEGAVGMVDDHVGGHFFDDIELAFS
jgi:hypothetical protein